MKQLKITSLKLEEKADKQKAELKQSPASPMVSSEVGQKKTNRKDWVGIRQGRLTVVALHKQGTHRSPARWMCQCDCGKTKVICSQSLRIGTQSCGCLVVERIQERAKHNKVNTGTYRSWKTMIQRCTNPNFTKYPRYGGRGITVCDEWMTFTNFYEDMGDRPDGYQIDRIDNNKGYYKENCRWADIKTQARNRSSNRNIEINGETKTMSEWCEIFNVSNVKVRMRIHRGMNPVLALTK